MLFVHGLIATEVVAIMEPAVDLLLSKLPPANLEKNIQWFRTHVPQQQSNYHKRCQQHHLPFQVVDSSSEEGERPFLICEYNRVGSCQYRSPWTNRLYRWKKNEDGGKGLVSIDVDPATTNEKVRDSEVAFNQVWDAYKNLYYGAEAVGSVYLNCGDGETSNLEGCFCVQKLCSDVGASWNSISLVRANEISECECEYTVDTTVHVIIRPMIATNDEQGESTSDTNKITIGTTMSKSTCKTCKVLPDKEGSFKSHIEHIGTIIEANETELRSNLERNVIPKHQETVVAIQSKQIRRPQVNPLMGMMMNSDMLKKRLAKSNSES